MNQLLIIVAFIGGVIFGWLAWGRPLKGAIRVHAALKAELAKLRIERFDEGYEHGADVVRTLLRTAIAARIAALPPLHCGRDPHLKLSEVLAVVRGEVPVVKRRKVKAADAAPIPVAGFKTDAQALAQGATVTWNAGVDPSTDRDAPDTGEVAA